MHVQSKVVNQFKSKWVWFPNIIGKIARRLRKKCDEAQNTIVHINHSKYFSYRHLFVFFVCLNCVKNMHVRSLTRLFVLLSLFLLLLFSVKFRWSAHRPNLSSKASTIWRFHVLFSWFSCLLLFFKPTRKHKRCKKWTKNMLKTCAVAANL